LVAVKRSIAGGGVRRAGCVAKEGINTYGSIVIRDIKVQRLIAHRGVVAVGAVAEKRKSSHDCVVLASRNAREGVAAKAGIAVKITNLRTILRERLARKCEEGDTNGHYSQCDSHLNFLLGLVFTCMFRSGEEGETPGEKLFRSFRIFLKASSLISH
jgi:hypothetical protein